jgi:hypothetical protein
VHLLEERRKPVRKQFSIWPTPEGFSAWDVHRLIDLARDLPVITIPLAEISELDEAYWNVGDPTPLTIREIAEHIRLIEDVDLDFPIILASNGRLMDGMHRVVRALLNGNVTIQAVRFTEQPLPDFEGLLDPSELSLD